MSRSQLRVYYGPQTDTASRAASKSADTVTVPLGEIMPLLADAVRSERTWLRDFEEDEVTISSDLYEVILAYQHFRRPSARLMAQMRVFCEGLTVRRNQFFQFLLPFIRRNPIRKTFLQNVQHNRNGR